MSQAFFDSLNFDFDNCSKEELAEYLKGSLLRFTMYFYYLRTGNKFNLPAPIGRECHYITLSRELTKVFNLEAGYERLYIALPPGHGKSEMLINFISWSMANYPDSKFLYISYAHDIASQHTYTIKQIIDHPVYKDLFGVSVKKDSSAKDNFKTNFGGAVKAFGSGGAVTGQDGGAPFLNRFSGCVVIDDIHKPDEVHSDVKRENVWRNYQQTIAPRARSETVPILFLGHRLHPEDTPSKLLNGDDEKDWKSIVLPALDSVGNVLCPDLISKERLDRMREKSPYKFWSQYQQTPQAPGGMLFKEEDFVILDEMPEIIATFITVDTAETDKTFNDATVFSLWGVYKIESEGLTTDTFALHWMACDEIWIEPKDLQQYFLAFYQRALTYEVKPRFCAIEKKSTGTTLVSILKDMRGLNIREIERNISSGSKTTRFIGAQFNISSRLISLPYGAPHTRKCIEHMTGITDNNTHARDDIADTCVDALQILSLKEAFFDIKPPAQETVSHKFIQQAQQNARLHTQRVNTWLR